MKISISKHLIYILLLNLLNISFLGRKFFLDFFAAYVTVVDTSIVTARKIHAKGALYTSSLYFRRDG